MIKEVHGDILLSSAQAIAHGVSPNDNFAQGLALALREQWPALYKDFRHFCQTAHPKAGEPVVITERGQPIRRIASEQRPRAERLAALTIHLSEQIMVRVDQIAIWVFADCLCNLP